ncbi:MAG: hypothetical protein RSF87_12700, partial [Cellulosilyticaceae bacterium]
GVGGKIFFDKTVLEATNQEVPTTIEEFYNVLKGMQGYDLNGNGVDDEIPFGAAKINDIIGALKGAWGLGTRGGSHANVDVDPKTGELRYIPISQEYKEVLMFTKKLYDEKLIDQEIFTMDTSKMMAKGESGRYLSHTYVNHTNVGQKYQDNQVPLTTALKGPYGDQLVPTSSNLGTIGAFVIPKTNKHPEVTMRWIDYFYSEEGMRMMFMGKEGVTYEVTADGKYEFLPEVMENPNGLSYEQALGQYVCYAGGANPSIAGEDYFRGPAMLPTAVEAAQNLIPFKADVIWPAFVYSKADNAEMQTLSGDITSYLKEMTAKFITGKVSFDEWDKYVAELNKMGLEKYMDIYKRTSEKYE